MALNIWRDFINKPRLVNKVSSSAEIGYNHYGPTFAVRGQLSTINSVVLIDNVCVEIISKNKKLFYYMDWFAFQPSKHAQKNFSEIGLTMTSKFTITPQMDYEYNILFIDNGRFSQMKALFEVLKNAWEKYLAKTLKDNKTAEAPTIFSEFNKMDLVQEATKRLETIPAWEQGEYLAKIHVTTKNPKQIFDVEKSFSLSADDQQLLAGNTADIIATVCQLPHKDYRCATTILK